MGLRNEPGRSLRPAGLRRPAFWLTFLLTAAALTGAPGRAHPATRFIPLTLGGVEFTAEVADTAEKQALGLMFRRQISPRFAMIFPYPDEDIRTFWMKNCSVSLDLIFVNRYHQIIGITPRVPPCRTEPCPVYASPSPAMFVIEVAGGRAAELGLREGDVARFSDP